MKKVALTCLLAMVLLPALPDRMVKAGEPRAGGWASVEVTNAEVVAAAHFAVQEQEKTLRGSNSKLSLIAIVSAEQQVVAGMNYRLKLKVKRDGKELTAEATVWWQAWNKEAPYKLTSWIWL